MTITYSGVEYTPTWISLQNTIMESLNITGRLTRIKRNDNGCSYRDKGEYSLTFTPDNGDNVLITLIVQ